MIQTLKYYKSKNFYPLLTLKVLILPLFFLGCATHLKRTPDHRGINTLSKPPRAWTATGKIMGQQHQNTWTASFTWEQKGTQAQIQLSPLLSTQKLNIIHTPQSTTIQTPKETFVTQNPEAFLAEHFGWHIPLSDFKYWLLGMSAPTTVQSLQKDPMGRIQHLKQKNWDIDYKSYMDSPNAHLPKKWYAAHPPNQMRVLIYQWSIQAS